MKLILCKNYEEMSEKAAFEIAELVKKESKCTLGLATGSTPVGTYQRLIDMYNGGELDFSGVTTFNLDEYYPINPDNDQSYDYFMRKNLFDHINVKKENVNIPRGSAVDPGEECNRYEELVRTSNPVDIQILGIGVNGHIGFNEPGEYLHASTHITDLTESTISANARFFESEDDVPKKAITMGIGTILRAKKIILLANGKAKHNAISALLDEKITSDIPATLLKVHNNVILICDEEAYYG
ncbi:MAG: glucosamine-6-phosphate deaminase [Ruminococcaceae bacterium]|nr:glucosamine-6-phosphate deaminase [Oscillospiraceae bacterium]